MTGWIIAAAELRIPWGSSLAAHRMVVVADEAGALRRQLNGLASWFDRASGTWRHKPIGYLPSDRLRVYDTNSHPHTWMPVNGVAPGSRDISPAIRSGAARVLAEGLSETGAAGRLAPALQAMTRINALSAGPDGGAGLPYPFLGFGPNSNSVFATLLAVMGFGTPVFSQPAVLAPGAGRLVLPRPEIAAIRADYSDLGTSGAMKPEIAEAIASTPSAVG
ncbi:MAG: hypothetical protein GC155_07485 [Alphaproteobacteria bacterium]|nr:hypothetical protein [Alphaproteobacteria bacterium]